MQLYETVLFQGMDVPTKQENKKVNAPTVSMLTSVFETVPKVNYDQKNKRNQLPKGGTKFANPNIVTTGSSNSPLPTVFSMFEMVSADGLRVKFRVRACRDMLKPDGNDAQGEGMKLLSESGGLETPPTDGGSTLKNSRGVYIIVDGGNDMAARTAISNLVFGANAGESFQISYLTDFHTYIGYTDSKLYDRIFNFIKVGKAASGQPKTSTGRLSERHAGAVEFVQTGASVDDIYVIALEPIEIEKCGKWTAVTEIDDLESISKQLEGDLIAESNYKRREARRLNGTPGVLANTQIPNTDSLNLTRVAE